MIEVRVRARVTGLRLGLRWVWAVAHIPLMS